MGVEGVTEHPVTQKELNGRLFLALADTVRTQQPQSPKSGFQAVS